MGRYGAIHIDFEGLSWGICVAIGGSVGSGVGSTGTCWLAVGLGVCKSVIGWKGVKVIVPDCDEVDKS